ncbi:MAG: CusA/CzcA family heavy metal efflux RND transporter [Bdellovibrionota bacterium]
MIEKLIAWSAKNRLLTFLLVGALTGWGYWSLRNTPLDAIPDLSDVQVILFTEWPGRSPDLVEDQITYPLVTTLRAAPEVTSVRGQTFFGLSFVNVIFEDGTDLYWARSRVLEYLSAASQRLPEGVTPILGPDATGVGWVFQYAVVDRSGKNDLQKLRAVQDFYLRYGLQSVEGVAEVAGVGGFEKEYQVQIDPNRLVAYGIPLSRVIDAVRDSNNDVGGRELDISGTEHIIRGRGYVKSVRDLEMVPVGTTEKGTPIFVRDLGEVHLAPGMRRGVTELDGQGETVGGVVVMRYGKNALQVIDAVKARLEELKPGLPEGVEVVVTYDRSELIQESIATVSTALIEEMIVVSLVIFIFLMHARSALVPIVTLPLAVLVAFIPMFYQKLTANIMSLGGIIVAIGDMVDGAIILVENVHKKIEEDEEQKTNRPRLDLIVEAMQEVGPSIFFSLLVITISFLPVFTLEGTEGRLFKPLAFTKSYSMAFAAILAVTLTPALAATFLRGKIKKEEDNPLNRWLIRIYSPAVRFVVKHRKKVIASSILIVLGTIPIFLKLGSEFMPPLNEGTILYMPTATPGMSGDQAVDVLHRMDRLLKEFPEVEHVFGKAGRAESATDPAPIDMIETIITLKPKEEWREGLTLDGLILEMDQKVKVTGMPNIWWMPIQTRTEMLATGIRSLLGIKVLGADLAKIEEVGRKIEMALAEIPETRTAIAERTTGGFFVDFEIRREEAARYGLTVGDVERVIESGIGGMAVSTTVEGRERYAISVRYAHDYRTDLDSLGRVLVAAPSGAQVPLAQLAHIKTVTGPPMIRDENGQLAGYVFVDVNPDVPVGDYVKKARAHVEETVSIPAGYRLEWGGQYRYLERARERLKLIVPLTLLFVFVLLYFNTGSLTETLIVFLTLPFSPVGAVWFLWLLDYNVSIAVWVGIVALIGLDAETSVVMLLYLGLVYKKWKDKGLLKTPADLTEAIVEGAARRIRPKLMTILVNLVGLAPVMWSTGTGADVMKRIAAPMLGGAIFSFAAELFVYPAIFALWRGRQFEKPPSP